MASTSFYPDRSRACFRPSVPIIPPLEAVIDRLTPAVTAVKAFDAKLVSLGIGAVGKLFARLDAVHSSGAEGTTTTFTDLLKYESVPEAATDPADAEIVAACAAAFEESLNSPDLVNTVLAIHRRLFAGSKDGFAAHSAGSFKTFPNGTRDSDEPDGTFYYTHPSQLPEALNDWVNFTNESDPKVPEIIRQICSHWMFEHIHPVKDGNGRIGRLLVPLVLKWKGETKTGCAFFGEAVHEDKDLYIGALKDARRTNDFAPWCRYMLGAIERTAVTNSERLDQLMAVASGWAKAAEGVRRDSSLHRMLPWILAKPAFNVRDAAKELGVTFASANNAVEMLKKLAIVRQADEGVRNRLFLAEDVLQIFDRFHDSDYRLAI